MDGQILSPVDPARQAAAVAHLALVADSLDISQTDYGRAHSAYKSIGEVVSSSDSPVFADALVFPQGSFATRTVVKPMARNDGELDVDLACRLATTTDAFSPGAALATLGVQLRSDGRYRDKVYPKTRCWRVSAHARAGHVRLDVRDTVAPLSPVGAGTLVHPASLEDLRRWYKRADQLCSRAGEVNAKDKAMIAAKAGYRCQFTGCGEDLTSALGQNTTGNYGYFAHIVAASPDGPRGHVTESPRLAKDATNILFLCDKHHRLIDRVAPDDYSIERLRAMREDSLARVETALGTLKMTEAVVFDLIANIEGQCPHPEYAEVNHALWEQNLARGSRRESLGDPGWHLARVHDDAFWASVMAKLPDDRRALRTALDRAQGAPLALFALHAMSVLIVYGRLVGDAVAVRLHQYHRNEAPGSRWTWPERPRSGAEFQIKGNGLVADERREAILLVTLTAGIDYAEVESLGNPSASPLPLIEVTANQTHRDLIDHPDKLLLFGIAVDEALRVLIDEWKVETIHLFPVAPASACFRLGQKIQARHQPQLIVYERVPQANGTRAPFAPTVSLTGTRLEHVQSGRSLPLTAES